MKGVPKGKKIARQSVFQKTQSPYLDKGTGKGEEELKTTRRVKKSMSTGIQSSHLQEEREGVISIAGKRKKITGTATA